MSRKKLLIIFAIIIAVILIGLAFWLIPSTLQNRENPNSPVEVADSSENLPESWHYHTRDKLLSGQWSMEEYLLNNLAFIVGESDNKLGNDLTIDEIHPTLRGANIYLKDGEDQTTKDKIKEYLTKIYTTNNLQKTSQKNLNPFTIKAQAQTATIETFEAQGMTHQIIYPEGVISIEALNDLIVVATQNSLEKYNELGYRQIPVQYTYNQTFRSRSDGGFDREVEASALANDDLTVCEINLWLPFVNNFESSAGIEDDDNLKQIIAHELYHCVQELNFPGTTQYPFDEWRIEGGAEYFSNVVYPFNNLEDNWNGYFDRVSISTPMYQMSYEANIFHQYLANKIGNDGLRSIYQRGPTSGGFDTERTLITSIPGIEELFHNFAKDYLSQNIIDTSGSVKPVTPLNRIRDTITSSQVVDYEVEPLVIGRAVKEYQHNSGNFTVTTDDEGGEPGKYNVKKIESGDDWIEMPETVPTIDDTDVGIRNCIDDETKETFRVVLTNTTDTSNDYKVQFDIIANDVEPSDDDTLVDPNLVGFWTLDEEFARGALDLLLLTYAPESANYQITNFDYNGSICFKADGVYYSDFAYSVDYKIDFEGFSIISNMNLITSNSANYSTSGGMLQTTNLNEIVIGQVTSTSLIGTNTTPLGQGALSDKQKEALDKILDLDPPTDPDDIETMNNLYSVALGSLISVPATESNYSGNYTIENGKVYFQLPIVPYPEISATKIYPRD